jgi:hypothetical protein
MPVTPNTFNSIPLDAVASADMPLADFVTSLLDKLEHLKDERAGLQDLTIALN